MALEVNRPRQQLNAFGIIKKKRDGEQLTRSEINWFVHSTANGNIANEQLAALLMAIYFRGLNPQETYYFTDSMLKSGNQLNFSSPFVVDKHSTGGVGDKTSFILAPIVASAQVLVPMISGRSLGHTGGTIDKLESIPGYTGKSSLQHFKRCVETHGFSIMGPSESIAPADKIIYAARNLTATISSIPLISASIMSKKLAAGISGLVFDIKVGSGAFCKTLEQGRSLAKSLISISNQYNKRSMAYLTNMNQPLGLAVGNSIEIKECIDTLNGNGPEDLTKLSIVLAGSMIYLSQKVKSLDEGMSIAKKKLMSGEALEKFKLMVRAMGGSQHVVDHPEKLEIAPCEYHVIANKSGKIQKIDTEKIGLFCNSLGAGRVNKDDQIDHSVGLKFHKKINDFVKTKDPILTIYHHPPQIDFVKNNNFLSDNIIQLGDSITDCSLIMEKIDQNEME